MMARDKPSDNESELESLRVECHRLERQIGAQKLELESLRAGYARYETALHTSKVIVYTQDRDLRYTSISHSMLGHSIEEILGRTDDEILPAESVAPVVALKREALANGTLQRTEMPVEQGGNVRWHDLHIEPLRDKSGDIVGLTCASVDVTERKEGEAHLRLLLRELTHRSKNLLAVIQAMARQTARHAGSTEGFLNQFGARLQALSASHDLLVRESWYGASLRELVRSQMRDYITDSDTGETRVSIAGDDVALKPEAAHNLGLALHEMAANAAKFGSLSVQAGSVTITWRRRTRDGRERPEDALELDWTEQGGPRVKPRRKKGFGTMVIEGNLSRALDAEVTLTFAPNGLRYHVVIPASQILTPN
jgi:PAS domain S-box-containing protein